MVFLHQEAGKKTAAGEKCYVYILNVPMELEHMFFQMVPEGYALVVSGWGILGWLLGFPFYGPLSALPPFNGAPHLLHSFVAGHALGLLGYGLGRGGGYLLGWRPLLCAAVAVLLFMAAFFVPLPLGLFFSAAAGLSSASPVLSWALALSGHKDRVSLFVLTAAGANVLCQLYFAGALRLSSPWAALSVPTIGYTGGSCLLAGQRSLVEREPCGSTVRGAGPILLFIAAVYPAGGFFYRTFMPLAGQYFFECLGFLPYVSALALGILLLRTLPLATLAGLSISVLGLSLLALGFFPGAGYPCLFAACSGILLGLGFADLFLWLSLLEKASAGYHRTLGLCLSANVAVLGAVATLADVASFTQAFRAPAAAFASAALLFALTPPVLSRLSTTGTPGATSADLARLTRAERKVLDLLLKDFSYKEIAHRLSLSPNTVKYHVRNIYRKMGCSSRQELYVACGRVDTGSKQEDAHFPDDFSRQSGDGAETGA